MTLGKTLLDVIHVLVGKLDLVSQRLLELIEVVLVGGLSFCCCVELGLALLQKTVQGVNDATAGGLSQTRSPWESNAGFVLQCMKTRAATRPCLAQPPTNATVGKTRRCNHGTMVALGYWFLKAGLELKIAFCATCVSMQICVRCRCTNKSA